MLLLNLFEIMNPVNEIFNITEDYSILPKWIENLINLIWQLSSSTMGA